MRRGRSLLLVLVSSFVLPVVVVFLVSLWGVTSHERAMGRVMDSYAMNIAQAVADKINSLRSAPLGVNRLLLQLEKSNLLSWSGRLPGWVMVLDGNGDVVISSREEEKPGLELPRSIVLNRSLRLTDKHGQRYSIAVRPTTNNTRLYVTAVVNWDDLLGPMVQSNKLFMFLLAASLITLICVLAFIWRWLIRPLAKLSKDVAQIRPGENLCQNTDPEAVYELRHLRDVICDMSQQVSASMALWKNYSSEVVGAQEQEKERLARDIHDGPVQAVTALVTNIRLSQTAKTEEERNEKLKLAEEIGSDTVKELRAVCDNLTPPWLDLGLEYALNELAERMGRYLGVKIRVWGGDVQASPLLVLTCFRLTQEAISNAVKHGQATEINVELDQISPQELSLTVSDNGKGFEVPKELEQLRRAGHRGLMNMGDRIRLVGGDMKILSEIGKGTVIKFRLPTEETQEEATGLAVEQGD